MTAPRVPPETGPSLVRNVAQGLRLVLESPEHSGIRVILSRATLERWCDRLYLALLLLDDEPPRDA